MRILCCLAAAFMVIAPMNAPAQERMAQANPTPSRSIEELRARHLQATRQALRDAVRKILVDVIGSEQSEAYEIRITFDTRIPGVRIPDTVKQQFPEYMSLVLQYQFRELVVGDDAIEVTVSFSQQWQRIRIPYAAITEFGDGGAAFTLHISDGLR